MRASKGIDALRNKGDIKQTNKHFKTFNTHPTKDALLNSGLLVFFFFHRIRTSELFVPCELVSSGVVI